MKPYRTLAPTPIQNATAQVTTSVPEPAVAGRGSYTSRRRHTAKEWEDVKDVILRTYAVRTLEDTIQHVKQEYGFEAGLRQYKNKLSQWGAEKHFKDRDMKFVSEKNDIRQHKGVPTVFLIRGAKIDPSRIQRFHTRMPSVVDQSPNFSIEVTPDGIMYYTPANLTLSPEALVQAAHFSSPMSGWSNLAVRPSDIINEDTVAANLMNYGNTVRRIEMLEVQQHRATSKQRRARRREMQAQDASADRVDWSNRQQQRKQLSKYDSESELDATWKRHVHKHGSFFVTASGLFRQREVLQSLVYEGNNFVVNIFNTLKSGLSQTTHAHHEEHTPNGPHMLPEYTIVLGSRSTRVEILSPVLQVIRSSAIIRRLMEVSDSNRPRWDGPWRRMNEDRVAYLTRLTHVLYGIYPAQGPDAETITILVWFMADGSTQLPSLLRITLVEDCSARSSSCSVCQNFAVTVDCIGLNGAAKFQAMRSSMRSGIIFDNFDEMQTRHHIEKTKFFTKWTRLANFKSGMMPMKHLRQCHCDGAVHQGGFRQHFVDMDTEMKARKEVWDPNPEDVCDDTVYDCYPAEQPCNETVFIENHLSESESDEEHWDPFGQEGRNMEAFDPYPSEDDGAYECMSRPIFWKVRHS